MLLLLFSESEHKDWYILCSFLMMSSLLLICFCSLNAYSKQTTLLTGITLWETKCNFELLIKNFAVKPLLLSTGDTF